MSEQEGERRLAAILSADVVGYSRLMSEDEAATIHTLRDYREAASMLIRQHRGRVVDAPGDNILAEFHSALEAVRCALEIQGVLRARNATVPAERRMEFRVGVHMGDVVVADERIYGDGVNIAARLEGLADAGGVCISATVHEQVRNKIDVGFTDLGDQTVKNMPDQVHVYRVQPRAPDAPAGPAPAVSGAPRGRRGLAAVAAVLLLVGIGLWASWPAPLGLVLDLAGVGGPPVDPALPDKPSVVVLPFVNMSGDSEQEFFADGITGELTAALSSNPTLFVISRNSAFSYKGKPVKVEEIGLELGVRYAVEGSVRKAGERVRVTAQLIDARDGVHIWSQQYDRDLADIFAVQSEISEAILGAVGVEVREAELARIRRRPTEDLNAYEAYSKGFGRFIRQTRKDVAEARRLLERAIEIDPNYVDAYAILAATHSMQYGLGWSNDPSHLDRARELLDQALEMDPDFVGVHAGLAAVELSSGRPERVIEHARRAIAAAPSFAVGHAFLALGLAQTGQPLDALQELRRAMRLDPRMGESALPRGIQASLYYATGRTDEAVALWERAREANTDLLLPRLELADHYMRGGHEDQARALVAEMLEINPDLTAAIAADVAGRVSPRDAESAALLGERLAEAGLP